MAWLDQRGLRERGLHHELMQATDALQANADAHELWLQARLAVVDTDVSTTDADADRAEVRRAPLPRLERLAQTDGRAAHWVRDTLRCPQMLDDYAQSQAARMAPLLTELQRELAHAGLAGYALVMPSNRRRSRCATFAGAPRLGNEPPPTAVLNRVRSNVPRFRPDECTVTGPACEAVERAATLDDFAAICRGLADTLPADAASLLSSKHPR